MFTKLLPKSLTLIVLTLLFPINFVTSFAFVFSESNNADMITHPIGYNGSGGILDITVGIDPTSMFANNMIVPTQNVINTFNAITYLDVNTFYGTIPNGTVDFESVLLHEMGHSLGLAHCNRGGNGFDSNYTIAQVGSNGVINTNSGADGVIGSKDDIRGDDINLNYFKIADNNPFTLPNSGIIDASTYSRKHEDLPAGHNFSANADIQVATTLGLSNTEAVMQQGTAPNESQRNLGADDYAGLKYAMSGIDEIQGNSDDYTIRLSYVGLTSDANIVIDFDNSEASFAVSKSGGAALGISNHIVITSNRIFFNSLFPWHFNTTLSTKNTSLNTIEIQVFPNPSSNDISIISTLGITIDKLTLYTITGKKVLSKLITTTEKNATHLEVSELNSGVYLLKIETPDGQITKQIIKK